MDPLSRAAHLAGIPEASRLECEVAMLPLLSANERGIYLITKMSDKNKGIYMDTLSVAEREEEEGNMLINMCRDNERVLYLGSIKDLKRREYAERVMLEKMGAKEVAEFIQSLRGDMRLSFQAKYVTSLSPLEAHSYLAQLLPEERAAVRGVMLHKMVGVERKLYLSKIQIREERVSAEVLT